MRFAGGDLRLNAREWSAIPRQAQRSHLLVGDRIVKKGT